MEQRRLGRSELTAAPLAFGGNVLGWTLSGEEAFRTLDRFVDAGFSLIDTADVYMTWADRGPGSSELLIGEWLKASGKRDKVLIATKVGMPMDRTRRGLSARYIAEAVDASLARLQIDCIDIYQAHTDDSRVPMEETLEAFDRLIQAGKVRVLGASNFSAGRLREALDLAGRVGGPRYELVQPHFNAITRDQYEGELQQLCVERGLGVIPFFSLAAGFLTGKYRSIEDLDAGKRGEMAKGYATPRGFRIVAAVCAVAARHGVPPAQVALAWSMAQPGIVAPIASATSVAQLDQISGAADLRLDADDLAAIERAGAD